MEDLKSYRIKIDLLKLQGASLRNVNLNGTTTTLFVDTG